MVKKKKENVIMEKIHNVVSATQEKVENLKDIGEKKLKAHPFTSVVTGAAVGFAIGLVVGLLTRRPSHKPTFFEWLHRS